jgi:hypothetical protein
MSARTHTLFEHAATDFQHVAADDITL